MVQLTADSAYGNWVHACLHCAEGKLMENARGCLENAWLDADFHQTYYNFLTDLKGGHPHNSYLIHIYATYKIQRKLFYNSLLLNQGS